ncbi:unnamed protein product, partial [Ectocarpus sp. 6 AP-2014]
VGSGWRHDRDLQQNPLRVGECICSRTDCVLGLYNSTCGGARGKKKDLCTKWRSDSGRRWAGTPRRALRSASVQPSTESEVLA